MIKQEATAGIIIASSILVARALAPVELAIANWKGFVAARQSSATLDRFARSSCDAGRRRIPLAAAEQRVWPSRASRIAPPGQQRSWSQDVSFTLEAGQGLGIIGPSASGKSSLARAHRRRLDAGARQGPPRRRRARAMVVGELGPHIGYLPQDIELFDGTVAAEHRALRAGARFRGDDRGGPGGRRA